MRQIKDPGAYDFVVLLASTTCGFLGGPSWIALAAGLLLTFSTWQEYAGFQPRLTRAGGARLMASAVLTTGLTCIFFASLCFGLGRSIRWLLIG